jgi:hypothetical protein
MRDSESSCWGWFGAFSFTTPTSPSSSSSAPPPPPPPPPDQDGISPFCSREATPAAAADDHHNDTDTVNALARTLSRTDALGSSRRQRRHVRVLRQRGCRALVGDERHAEEIRSLVRKLAAERLSSHSEGEDSTATPRPRYRRRRGRRRRRRSVNNSPRRRARSTELSRNS